MQTIHIKNMVCNRCIMAIEQQSQALQLPIKHIQLGEVEFMRAITAEELKQLSENLSALGFEIIDDKNSQTIVKIKTAIIELIHHKNMDIKINISDYLSEKLQLDYTYLSNLFSQTEGITIERYFILQKIEKVKELLVYDELTLSQIADQLNYSSVAYLSNQFKKITGLTPSHFKSIKNERRKPLDKV